MNSRWDRFDPATAWQPWQPQGNPGENQWDFAAAAHLNRRVAFGATWQQVQQDSAGTVTAAIARMLDGAADSDPDRERMADVLAASGNARSLSAAWILRMAQTTRPALERATLFWHGHFATSAAKVTEARLMLQQNRLLREHALGPLEPLVQAIARDPAMLVYLDSRESRRSSPNENFARELMELFCLGTGNYTEADIREMARCFTGWEIRYSKFRFNSFQHDRSEKKFLGHQGTYGGDDAVRAVVQHPACARFVTGKLVRYYVADDFPADSPLLEPLAESYRNSGYDAGQLIREIVSSNLFFSPECRGSRISSPVELAVRILRTLRMEANVQTLAESLGELGQLPYFPPSVKGWDGGTAWINAQTMIGRANLVERLVRESGDTMRPEFPGWSRSDREQITDSLCQLFFTSALPDQLRDRLDGLARQSGTGAREFLADTLATMAMLPEFHLA